MLALLACVILAQPQPVWIAPTPAVQGPTPSWIWANTTPRPTTENAPAGFAYFARSFDAPQGVTRAMLAVAADNSATIWLNGAEVGRVSSWSAPRVFDLALQPGPNAIAVEAANDAAPPGSRNPAGLIASLALSMPDGSMEWIVTDEQWWGAAAKWPGFPNHPPAPDASRVAVLGPVSAAPWGLSTASFTRSAPCPMLRRSFIIEGTPTEAKIRVVGLGHYELTCNGRRVGQSVINQAWSQYDKTLYWQEFDLAPYLRRGENVLGVLLGNSFWSVTSPNDDRRFSKTDAMPDFSRGWPNLLWLDGVVRTNAGEVKIVSDESWTWSPSPLTFSHIYAGEDWDARLEQPGWDYPAFTPPEWASWRPVVVAPAPQADLVPLPGLGMWEMETFSPTEVRPIEPGVFTYVFPQNCSALLAFTIINGDAGDRIRFKPCEYMDESGRVKFTYTWGTGKDIWHDYTLRDNEQHRHQIAFCYVGAQFLQVEGAVPLGDPNPLDLPVIKSIKLVHVRAANPRTGEFASSSPMHNAAHRIIDWAIRSNMAHVPTDCPHREKNGWIEQDWHMARALSYGYDVQAWLAKTCRDIRDAQQADGHIPTNCPNYLVGVPPHGFWNNAPEWGIAGVLVPWHLYEWYGDRAILEENYDSARRYIDYLTSTAVDGVITSNLGDWYDFGHGKGNGPSRWTPNEVSATAIWALGAGTLARMAEVLGRDGDAAAYRALFNQIRADFQRQFYDPATRTVKHNGSCQAGAAAALCIGLIPDQDRPAALDAIVADLEARGWKQTPGEVLQVFLIRALAENGRGDVLHRIYNREDIPSYGHMVNSGLTTLPESWDARRGTGDSLNHFMLGHLMEWHYAYVAGLRQAPDSVGWNEILIAPQPPPRSDPSPNAIRSVDVRFDSPAGPIHVAWEIKSTKFELRCDVPEGVAATVILPDGSRHVAEPGDRVFECEW